MPASRIAAVAAAAAASAGALFVACKVARRSPDFGNNWSLRSIITSIFMPYSLKAELVGSDLEVLKYLTEHSSGDLSIPEYEKIRQVGRGVRECVVAYVLDRLID